MNQHQLYTLFLVSLLEVNACIRMFRALFAHLQETLHRCCLMYMVRQFNSRNGPVKAKFAYKCTNGR
jgi:hypothetical protein